MFNTLPVLRFSRSVWDKILSGDLYTRFYYLKVTKGEYYARVITAGQRCYRLSLEENAYDKQTLNLLDLNYRNLTILYQN